MCPGQDLVKKREKVKLVDGILWVRDETQGDRCIWKDGSSPLFSSRRILGILAYNILSLEPVKPVTLPGSS